MRLNLLRFFGKELLILTLMLLGTGAFAQTTVFQFQFENNTTPNVDNATGTPSFATSGTGGISYNTTNPCGGLRLLSDDDWDTGDYHRFTVNTSGYSDLQFSVCGRTDNTSIGTFIGRVSSDNGATWTTVIPSFTPGTTNSTSTSAVFPVGANNNGVVLIDLYKTNNANANGRDLIIDNATLTGYLKPIVSSFSPAGPICAGTGVAVTGINFTGVTGVTLGGSAVPYVVNSATSITITPAAGAASGVIAVTNAAGTGQSAGSLTVNYVNGLTASAVSPTICVGSSTQLNASATSTPFSLTASNSTGQAIPNNNTGTGISSNITVSACANASSVASVVVNMDHDWNEDVDMYLIAPDGSQIALTTDKGGNGNDITATFQTGGAVLPTGNSSINGTYAPQQAFSGLTGTATGSWTLRVFDDANHTIFGFPTANSGTLNSWAITFVSTCASSYTWTPATGLSSTTIANPVATPASTQTYTVTASNGLGCSSSTTVTVTVNPISVGGSVAGSTAVCAPTNSGSLTLSGHTGSVTGWESSLNNFATTGTPIANTTTTLSYTNLTQTTYYRAIVKSGTCSSTTSSVATITIAPASVGGTVAGSTTVCGLSNSGSVTLSGHTGSVTGWESSLDNFATAGTPIANTTTTLSYTNLAQTTYYRAIVQNGSCTSATSSVAAITVTPVPVGGTLAGSVSVCASLGSGLLTLSGQVGSISGWEFSYDNFATAGIPIANITASHLYINLAQTTYYRCVIQNGGCAPAYSSVATVSVDFGTTWTGANGTSWHDAGNWSCGVVPTSLSNVTIAATANQPVIGADANANTLVLETGSTLTLQSTFDLTIQGAIDTQGSDDFIVENDANLIQVNDVSNTGSITVKRNSSALKRQDYTIWSSPVAGQNLLAFSPQTLANRFYTYNAATNQYNTVASPASTSFGEGTGYLIRMPNNHPTTPTIWNGQFTGVPNNGDTTVALSNTGVGLRFNAIGNPYPSAIDMEAFVSDNSTAITGTLYFWRKTNNNLSPSYCSWTSGGGFVDNGEDQVSDPNGILRTGQGFIVEASAGGSSVTFNNGQRVGDNADQFFRNATEVERNRIWLNATGAGGAFSQTLVGYITGSTMGADFGIDGKYFNDGDTELYSLIGGDRYVIQGRTLPFVDTDVVPMGFKATTAGNYTIAIDHVDGLFLGDQDILLRDNVTNVVHDLKAGGYDFASAAGTFASRFEVLYQNALGTHDPVFGPDAVIVYKDKSDFVVNSGSIAMASVRVYDVRGRLVAEIKDINATQATVGVSETNQVLIFKITSVEGQQVNKKVVN